MKTKIIISLAGVMIAPILLGFLFWNGTFLLNNPSKEQYPVRGVDVSSYQGEIDWPVLAAQKIDFAFLKATEGSSFVDKHFADNLAGAQKTDLRVGAYHFFSYDSSSETQAENSIATVPQFDLMLPPVVNVEFYGDKEKTAGQSIHTSRTKNFA